MNWEMLAPLGIVLTILAPFVGAYLVFYGIRDGLVRKRILSRKNPEVYSVGREAVTLGSLIIVFGLFLVVTAVLGLIHEYG